MEEGVEAGEGEKKMSQPRMEPKLGGGGMCEKTDMEKGQRSIEGTTERKGWPEEPEECWGVG